MTTTGNAMAMASPFTDQTMGIPERALFMLLATYLILNRAIADIFVLPIGISLRIPDLVLALAVLAWMVWLVHEPRPLPRGVTGLVGLLFLVAVLTMPFINTLGMTPLEEDGAERGVVKVILLAGLFLGSFHIASNLRSAKFLLKLTVALTALQGSMAIYEFFSGTSIQFLNTIWLSLGLQLDPGLLRGIHEGLFVHQTGALRAASTAPHPLVLAGLLGLGASLAILVMLDADRLRSKVFWGLTLLLQLGGLAVTNSRTGVLVLVSTIVAVGLSQLRRWRTLIPASFFFLIATGVTFAASPGTARLMLNTFLSPFTDSNVNIRINRTAVIPQLLSPRPIFGAGYLTLDSTVMLFDNAYYLGLIEFGIVGLALFLSFVLLCAWQCAREAIRQDPDRTLLVLGGLLGAITLLVAGAGFDAWTFDQLFPTCILLMGMGLGHANSMRKSERTRTAETQAKGRPSDTRHLPRQMNRAVRDLLGIHTAR